MASDRRLFPFFTYYGSKWKTIRRYPAPTHPILIEPFAGAASYAVRYPDLAVKLFDRNPIIVGIWRYLIRTSAEEIRRLPLLSHEQTVDDLASCGVPEEARWLIGFWLNKSQVSPARRASAWARTPQWAYQFWGPERRERVAAQVDRIRHWQVFELSYEQAPNIAATWFIDPPYVGRPGAVYKRYGSDHIDFERLGAWCRSRIGQTIVCEHASATWLPFRPIGEVQGTRRRGTEAMWP